jgi:low affinity Fe/Cu permease
MSLGRGFAKFANWTAHASGHPITFILCCLTVIVWAVSGPFFGFSETWQLIINTGTTIITFLMVFLIQNTQNRDGAAIQAKLDELIRASEAQNMFIGIENLSQEEVESFRKRCEDAARDADTRDTVKNVAGTLARKARDAHAAVEKAEQAEADEARG